MPTRVVRNSNREHRGSVIDDSIIVKKIRDPGRCALRNNGLRRKQDVNAAALPWRNILICLRNCELRHMKTITAATLAVILRGC